MKRLVSMLLMLALLCAGAAAVAECTHPNGTKVSDSSQHKQVNTVYKNITNDTHDRYFDIEWAYYCDDCKTTYTVTETGCSEKNEKHGFLMNPEMPDCGCGRKKPCETEHQFTDGVCSVCGYECGHADSTKRQYGKWLNTVYTNVNSQEYHHAKYDYAEVYDCNTCGAEYYVVIEEGREDNDEHEWLKRPDANLTSCSMCGVKKPCDTHAGGSVVSTTNSAKSYTSTAEGHVASYTRTTVYKCSTCGWEYSEAETVTEDQAGHTFSGSTCTVCKYTCSAHSYEEGTCTICGTTCAHANATHNGKGTSKLVSAVDHRDGTHTREFEVWHQYECPTCKYVFEKYIEMGTETEPHEYPNNRETCIVCGAKKACAVHTKSSVAKETDGDKTYTFAGATQHTASFERTTLYNCDVCGWQFSEKTTVTEPASDHSFDEGVCAVCGHVCEHAYEDGVMFCVYCGMQAPTRIQEASVEEALTALPEESKAALADAGFETAEQITEELTVTAVKQGYAEEQVQVIDVTLQVQVTNVETGKEEWVEVTPDNFPDEGLEVTFDPPAGTNVNDYNFLVVHMFTSPDKAGQVEVLTPTVRDGKLVVKFTALSPVSISWKAKPQAAAAMPQTGDDSMLLMWAALLAVSCTALVMKKRSRA